MIDLEPEELEILGRARRGLSASPQDRERVLLALGPSLSAASEPALPKAGSKLLRWGRIGGGSLILALAVTAGYGWGYRAGSQARPNPVEAPPARVMPPVAAPVVATPTLAPPAPAVVLERASAPKTTSGAASAAAPAPAAAAAGLDEEVRQLRRIERAIRDGNSRLALAIGDNLDREIPQGQLLLERRAARLMASCQLDAATSAGPAARFLADNPHSAYAQRLRDLCGLAQNPQRNGTAPGTNHAENGGSR